MFFKRKKKESKASILKRPYSSYINGIYVVMNYGKKVEILPDFRVTPSDSHGYVAGLNNLGYINVDVINGTQTSRRTLEAYMLD